MVLSSIAPINLTLTHQIKNTTDNVINEVNTNIIELFEFYYTPLLVYMGIFGNILSVYVFFTTKLRKLSSTYYLSALAISDSGFLLTIFGVWLKMINIDIFNRPVFCEFFVYLTSVCSFLSVWLVVSFTIERFIAVKYPLLRQSVCTVARARSVVIILTIIATTLFAPQLIFASPQYDPEHDLILCKMNQKWQKFSAVFNVVDTFITFVIPVIIIAVLNGCISRTVWKLARVRRRLTGNNNGTNTSTFDQMSVASPMPQTRNTNITTGDLQSTTTINNMIVAQYNTEHNNEKNRSLIHLPTTHANHHNHSNENTDDNYEQYLANEKLLKRNNICSLRRKNEINRNKSYDDVIKNRNFYLNATATNMMSKVSGGNVTNMSSNIQHSNIEMIRSNSYNTALSTSYYNNSINDNKTNTSNSSTTAMLNNNRNNNVIGCGDGATTMMLDGGISSGGNGGASGDGIRNGSGRSMASNVTSNNNHFPRLQVRHVRSTSTSQTKVTKMLLIVSSVFLCLNLPSYVIRIVAYLIEYKMIEVNLDKFLRIQQLCLLLFYTSFGINFVLYCSSGQNFRKALHTSLCSSRQHWCGVHRNSTNQNAFTGTTNIVSESRTHSRASSIISRHRKTPKTVDSIRTTLSSQQSSTRKLLSSIKSTKSQTSNTLSQHNHHINNNGELFNCRDNNNGKKVLHYCNRCSPTSSHNSSESV